MIRVQLSKQSAESGLTKREIAKRAGLSEALIYKIEKNNNVTLKTLEKIADVLGCSIFDLLEEEK